jgi:hypothetical protein
MDIHQLMIRYLETLERKTNLAPRTRANYSEILQDIATRAPAWTLNQVITAIECRRDGTPYALTTRNARVVAVRSFRAFASKTPGAPCSWAGPADSEVWDGALRLSRIPRRTEEYVSASCCVPPLTPAA